MRPEAGLQKQTLTGDKSDPYLHAPKGGEEDQLKKFRSDRRLPVRGHDLVRVVPSDPVLCPGDYINNKKV